jgi:PIN domain nuclease of toxin-antitoxin system
MIILDTHIFVWLDVSIKQIPRRIFSAIEKADILGISAISLWEIAMLADKGRIALPLPTLPWFEKALSVPFVHILPITPKIAATALEHDCSLATVDENLINLESLSTIL